MRFKWEILSQARKTDELVTVGVKYVRKSECSVNNCHAIELNPYLNPHLPSKVTTGSS